MINVREHFTDDEWDTVQKIQKTFSVLEDLTVAMTEGTVKGLIVYGPAGVSKTFSIDRVLKKKMMKYFLVKDGPQFNIISGYMRTPHLFVELWKNRRPNDVLVIDDCDSALQDQDSLMLLKAALDTTERRNVTYNAVSPFLKREGVPNTFEFEGSVIFITNTNFRKCNAPKIKDHLDAIMSRCHYLDINIGTDEKKFLWIKYVSLNSKMLTGKGLSVDEILVLLRYLESNILRLNDLSLRAILKLADLFAFNKQTWAEAAEVTMLSNAA